MGEFAGGEDAVGTGYWRWLAPAWSGKTALMAEFALNPPAGVVVLAFFITARMAGRSDRTAFLATLQEQLRAYLQDPDIECASYGGFHYGLQRAAENALSNGCRLVLLIDGMDEDSGVESAVSGYSIAGLLPRVLPDGLRIILAGRPNPPVPSDVAPDHPIRSTSINHCLTESAVARAVREDAERSLEALIAAGGISLDLVGLTAAAGGGLSSADLASLTKEYTARRIEVVLGGATGRSFQLRPAQWAVHEHSPVALYSFAHQELLTGARHLLPVRLMQDYRDRIHEFVASYREAGWPADTPEYALMGYPQMLRERRDAQRLTALAIDQVRQDRMWQVTGSDTRALVEISDSFTLHRAAIEPDLTACVQLSHYRDLLKQKALNIPLGAIFAWAQAGHILKAVALISVRVEFALNDGRLFGFVLNAALEAGETDIVMAGVHSIPNTQAKDAALRHCSLLFSATGRWGEATEAARSISSPILRTSALVSVAQALVKEARTDEAVDLAYSAAEMARTIASPDRQASVLADVAEVLAKVGKKDEAVDLAYSAAEVARTITTPDDQAPALADVAKALAKVGKKDEAVDLAYSAAEVARTITTPDDQASARSESNGSGISGIGTGERDTSLGRGRKTRRSCIPRSCCCRCGRRHPRDR